MDNDYACTNFLIPKCSKCNCEIKEFNLISSNWCDCNINEENNNNPFIPPKNRHISEIYNFLEFEEQKRTSTLKRHEKFQKKISNFIEKTNIFLKNLFDTFFESKGVFNFIAKKVLIDNNNKNEQKIIKKIIDKINNLYTSKIFPETLNKLRIFILDINFFILILKKNPYISKKIIIQNKYINYDENNKDDLIECYYSQFQAILECSFCEKNFCYSHNSFLILWDKKLKQTFPIIERNIILLIYNDYIEIYNYILKKIVHISKVRIDGKKILKINPEYLIFFDYYNKLNFAKIEYDLIKNPISLYILYNFYYSFRMKSYLDFDIINENNIVCIDNRIITIYKIFYGNPQKTYDISRTKKIEYEKYNSIIADKKNNLIIIYSSEDYFYYESNYNLLRIYDLNLVPKKDFAFKDKIIDVKILNSDLYGIIFKDTENATHLMCLFSSKYLEIVSKHHLSEYFGPYNNKFFEKSNKIISFIKGHKIVYKIFRDEIILDEDKEWMSYIYNPSAFNIVEINEKGDYIIIFLDWMIQLYYINNEKVQRDKLNGEDIIKRKIFERGEIGTGRGRGIGRGRKRGRISECPISYKYCHECYGNDFYYYNDIYEKIDHHGKYSIDYSDISNFTYDLGYLYDLYDIDDNSWIWIDDTINTDIRKDKDNYQKKMKKKLKMKKDRNTLKKRIKKHYSISGRKLKNVYENESNNHKKMKKYVKKYVIKMNKKYKNEYEKEIDNY